MTEARAWRCDPKQLSELEHDIYLWIEKWPAPMAVNEILDAANRADSPRRAPRALVSRGEVERAITELARLGYLEMISRPADELFRLTDWGEATAGGRQFEVDPCWDDKPHLYEVYKRSGGMFDECADYKRERVMWTGPLMEISEALDLLAAKPGTGLEGSRLLRIALETLIVLVEPWWWREHSPAGLSPDDDRRWLRLLRTLDGHESHGSTLVRAAAAGPEATWRALESVVTAAVETFVRAGYAEGLEGCARLVRAVPLKEP